jgi:rhodanese-related sulfurtransferase
MAGIFGHLFRRPAAGPRWVEVDELRQHLAGVAPPFVLDVRGPQEFEGPLGHIDGARNIPLDELDPRCGEIAAGRPIVCVCLTDKRSAAAAAQLTEAGVSDVAVLRGGMKAWRER